MATRFRAALDAHFALEEDVVFPALHGSDPRSGKQIERLLSDHVVISAEVRRLIDTSGEAGTVAWRAGFYELRRSLVVHEAREEGVVNAGARRSD
jgi:iron-sulfur cluster repair protein YtfE (RIC family)